MAPLQLDLGILIILKGCHNCQLSTVNCQFGEAAKQQFIFEKLPSVLLLLFPKEQAEKKADGGGADPAKAKTEEGKEPLGKGCEGGEDGTAGYHAGHRADHIKDCRDKGEGGGPDIDTAAVAEGFSKQGQQNQGDGQRIQEHEHGDAPGHNGV